jgi:hypothetical protein
MALPFFAEFVGARTVARFVRLVRAVETGGALCSFLTSKIAKAIVFGFGVVGGVVEGWREVNLRSRQCCTMYSERNAAGERSAYHESPIASFP